MAGTSLREHISAARGLKDWEATVKPVSGDEVYMEVRNYIEWIDGEYTPSHLSEEIFGDLGNSHCLAILQRLQILESEGIVKCDHGCVYTRGENCQPHEKPRARSWCRERASRTMLNLFPSN